ncbi:1,4-alpha-glucan branching enzyme [candidate division KSB3 bacterium]|uniref:1,4-alpha-glucan branching enzyme GlgB n=1 Tax=candidate division KSB3 bacterium TaxID=2044937 RepID=A0A2G6KKP5_9BACT|nr:MAG: 1,4-alpha-glucan branching enzyme [candidate division KSB3 bacterium]
MTQAMLSRQTIRKILSGTHSNPFSVLGMHEVTTHGEKKIVVRAFLPGIEQAAVHDTTQKKRYPMARIHEKGFFEAVFTRRRKKFAYQLETIDDRGKSLCAADPYSFPCFLSDEDLALFQAGKHYHIYEKLGCHPMEMHGVPGALFAVWAPNAKGVSVVGDFNDWTKWRHAMRFREKWGVWELFIPGVDLNDRYQYEILTQHGDSLTKSDPYGAYFEQAPKNRSIVTNLNHFEWDDRKWMDKRVEQMPASSPLSIYEVHVGSWLKKPDGNDGFLSYRELAKELIPYVKEMGFTHLELLPVAEHPFYGSWGYQVTGYYAPNSRYGTPEDFKYFINECHRQGLGVIIDWVPAHFPKDAFSLGSFDGTYLYEHADPRMGEHKDWGTLIFNYGRNEVKNFLLANALFWFDLYHIDGIRVDAVASMLYLDYSRQEGEWLPNKYGGRENLEAIEFLKELNALIHERFPGTMSIAEESTSWLGVTYPTYLGGLDFTFKWNLGWMNDILHYLSHTPALRRFVHTMVPFTLHYAFHEHFMLELSHDEVVHGKGSLLAKMPGDDWQKFANLRLLYGFMFGHPGKKLLFMGAEFAQWKEWNHDRSLEWSLLQYEQHQGIQRYIRDLNHLYTSEPALYRDDTAAQCFEWIDHHDYDNSVFSFMRKTVGHDWQFVVFICNFTPVTHEEYRVGVPMDSDYRELMNSDAEEYGGQSIGTIERCSAEPIPWQQQAYSISLTIPPLSVLMLQPIPKGTLAQETPETLQKTTLISQDDKESVMPQEGKIFPPEQHVVEDPSEEAQQRITVPEQLHPLTPRVFPKEQPSNGMIDSAHHTLHLASDIIPKRQGIKILDAQHQKQEFGPNRGQPHMTKAAHQPIAPLTVSSMDIPASELQLTQGEERSIPSEKAGQRSPVIPLGARSAYPQGSKADISKNHEQVIHKKSSG